MKKVKYKKIVDNRYKGDLRIGSDVFVLSGKDKDTISKIIDFDRKRNLVKIENCFMQTHFVKDSATGTVKKERWIPVCKVKKHHKGEN